jgi:hypothetical protein
VPVIPTVYRDLRARYARFRLKVRSTEGVFTQIYRSNAFGGQESVSGSGSDSPQTRLVAFELPRLMHDLQIATMLDIPCGDFHWMRSVDLDGIDYVGADIVKDLIRRNTDQFARVGVRFKSLNLIADELPRVDMVLCRDCLVHFSYSDIFSALTNICSSESEYLLTTTFPVTRDNRDIVTGEWRAISLEHAPFGLPAALRLMNEGCTQYGGKYEDKALGLWKIADIRDSLASNVRPRSVGHIHSVPPAT